jgi:hypothetical protein
MELLDITADTIKLTLEGTPDRLSFTSLGILLNVVCPLPTIFEGKA